MLRNGLKKPSTTAGLPSPKHPLLYLVNRKDVKKFPEPLPNSILLDGDIDLNLGAMFMVMYATPQKQKRNIDTEGDFETRLFRQKVTAWHPGDEQEMFEFLMQTNNEGYIMIMDHCDGGPKKVFGTNLNPMYHNMNWEDSSDTKGSNIIFENAFSDVWPLFLYEGKMLVAEPGKEYRWVLADNHSRPIVFSSDKLLQLYP